MESKEHMPWIASMLTAVVAFVAVRFIESLLFRIPARDPIAFAGAMLTILVVAVVATLIPARRATRVDPVVALRAE